MPTGTCHIYEYDYAAHLPAIAELSSQIILVANWSRSEASAQDFKEHAQTAHGIRVESYYGEDGLDELLSGDRIDAVSMALPSELFSSMEKGKVCYAICI